MGQVVGHARLAGRHLIGVVGDDIELPKSLVVYARGRDDLRAVTNVTMSIDVSDGFAVRGVAEQLHGVSDDSFIWIGVARATSRGNRLAKVSEAWLRFVLYNLVHVIHNKSMHEVPLQ